MKCLVAGHTYELTAVEGSEPQILQFIHKEMSDNSVELVDVKDGTSNEEVILVLLDRMMYLNLVLDSTENDVVIFHLNECLKHLNRRTEDRLLRGVEGTCKP